MTHFSQVFATLDWLARVNLLVLPVAILLGVATTRRHRGALGAPLSSSARPGEIREPLARAIGDPSLELALWLPAQRHFRDEDGSTVDLNQDIPEERSP